MTCKYKSLLDLSGVEDDTKSSSSQAREWLEALGHSIGMTSIKVHRSRLCSCYTAVEAAEPGPTDAGVKALPQPRLDYDATGGTLVTAPRPATNVSPGEAELFAEYELDPAHWQIVSIGKSKRQANSGEWFESYRASFKPRPGAAEVGMTAAEMEAVIERHTSIVPEVTERSENGSAFLAPAGDLQVGKGLSSDTPVLTTGGWVKHGDLSVGMHVYGKDGQPKKVLDVLPTTDRDLYEVELGDGTIIRCDDQHQWSGYRKYHTRDKLSWVKRHFVVSLPELKAITEQSAAATRPFVLDASEPVVMPERDLPIDPYMFGAWLGDGSSRTGAISVGAEDRCMIEDWGHEIPSNSRGGTMYSVRIPGLSTKLRALGVLGCKRVPEEYIFSSVEQRLALVQGLMDTDGYADTRGACEFSNTNQQIVESLVFVLSSLGVRTKVREYVGRVNGKTCLPYWRVNFRSALPVFRLARKAERQREAAERRDIYRSVRAVRYVGRGDAQCITVEGGLYLAGDRLTVTHNCDGGGTAGILARFADLTMQVKADFLRKRESEGLSTIVASWLGDCIEGIISQGGRLATRQDLWVTEEVALIQRLMMLQIETYAPLTDRLIVPVVPGNHDENTRFVSTGGTDSWAIHAASSVLDTIKKVREYAPGTFANVEFVFPQRGELTATVDVCGSRVVSLHGHQFRGGITGAEKWLAGHSLGRQAQGGADILLCGHLHHFHAREVGQGQLLCQIPALDGGSDWFRQRTGATNPAGLVSLITKDGAWRQMTRYNETGAI